MPVRFFLLLLICTDVAFVVLHLINAETGWFRGVRISLEAENGLPETFQYIKEFWIAVALGFTFLRTRAWAFAVWSLIFTLLLLDDAAQIHEGIGTWIGHIWSLPSIAGLRPDDAGEVMFAATVGGIVCASIAVATWRDGQRSWPASRDLLCLIVLLGVLGVAVDMLHVVAYMQRSLLSQVLLVIEDGGEMVVMSMIAVYAIDVAIGGGRASVNIWTTIAARFAAWQPSARGRV